MGVKLQAQRRAAKPKRSPDYLARKTAKRNAREDATLYNPAEVLSGAPLRAAVNAAADLQVNPAIKAAAAQAADARGVGNEQIRRSGVYGGQLDQVQTENYALQSALKDKASQRMADISTQESNKVDSSGQAAQDQWAKDESVRGVGLEGGGEAKMAAENQAAKNRQGLTSLAYRSAEESNGDNRLGLALASRDVSINRSKETEGTLRNRTQVAVDAANARKADAIASKGGVIAQLALKMRGDEFDKLATIQGLGLKRDTLAQDAALGEARINATTRGQDIAAETSRSNNANSNATSAANNAASNATSRKNNKTTNKGKGKSGKKPTKTDTGVLSNIAKTKATYLKYKGRPAREIYSALVNSGKFSAAEIAAGSDLATRGYVLPANRKKYKGQLGLLPSNYRKKVKDPTPGGQGKASRRAPGGT